jgi:hypothetical protein
VKRAPEKKIIRSHMGDACGESLELEARRIGLLAFFAMGTLPGRLISTASGCLLTAWDADHFHLPSTGFNMSSNG